MTLDLWHKGCERLAAELPEQQFNTWIRPLPEASVSEASGEDTVVTLKVPNRFKLDWIRNQYAGRIQAVLSELAGKPVRLEIALSTTTVGGLPSRTSVSTGSGTAPVISTVNAPVANGASAGAAQGLSSSNSVMADAREAARNAPAASPPSRSRLNSALTFDTLVPGRANQMARTAALHVAGAPGAMYNPLFIYGGVGLGKTHLIHAVGNALLADNPNARILYLHAEQFITDVVKNYQRKTFDE
ncbi:MAG: DnaA/Hda family protein, partial [Pseudomonadota bacterium]